MLFKNKLNKVNKEEKILTDLPGISEVMLKFRINNLYDQFSVIINTILDMDENQLVGNQLVDIVLRAIRLIMSPQHEMYDTVDSAINYLDSIKVDNE